MDEKIETFEAWAIVEVFGHVRLAGRVTEQEIAGRGFVRVDVPETAEDGGEPVPGFTRFYGPDAIYSITPTDEATARLAVATLRPSAITVYIPSRLLAASSDVPADEDDWGGPYTDPIYEDEDDEPENEDEYVHDEADWIDEESYPDEDNADAG